jgi:hypothetical protein
VSVVIALSLWINVYLTQERAGEANPDSGAKKIAGEAMEAPAPKAQRKGLSVGQALFIAAAQSQWIGSWT